MFSALPRTAPQGQMVQVCAIATLEILKAHSVASGDLRKVDYEYGHPEAQIRFLERIEHGLKHRADAKQLHESWRYLMSLDDWKRGHVYCPTAKTDPHLVAYHELDATRRFKDDLVVCSIWMHPAH